MFNIILHTGVKMFSDLKLANFSACFNGSRTTVTLCFNVFRKDIKRQGQQLNWFLKGYNFKRLKTRSQLTGLGKITDRQGKHALAAQQ